MTVHSAPSGEASTWRLFRVSDPYSVSSFGSLAGASLAVVMHNSCDPQTRSDVAVGADLSCSVPEHGARCVVHFVSPADENVPLGHAVHAPFFSSNPASHPVQRESPCLGHAVPFAPVPLAHVHSFVLHASPSK